MRIDVQTWRNQHQAEDAVNSMKGCGGCGMEKRVRDGMVYKRSLIQETDCWASDGRRGGPVVRLTSVGGESGGMLGSEARGSSDGERASELC